MLKGKLHSLETLGALDGPGLRTVFFLQGCNMKCLYCHNRDSWDPDAGSELTIDSILDTVQSNRAYYGKKGGVTFSGGEPLLQSAFLLQAVKALKEAGVHTVIDTSGSLFNAETKELFRSVDLVILDVKHSDSAAFRELCGLSDGPMRQNLAFLQREGIPYWIRQVIVPGVTDSHEQMDAISEMIYREEGPEKTELLPYHAMGLEKWRKAGDRSPLEGWETPSQEIMDQLNSRLRRSSTVSRK